MENIEFTEKEKDVLISETEPIEDSAGKILTKENIKKLIEPPLANTIKSLIEEYGIQPISSSANKKDIEGGKGHITINYDSLSEENKKRLKEKGYKPEAFGIKKTINVIEMTLPINKVSTSNQIEEESKKLLDIFTPQPANWIPEYSKEEIMNVFSYKNEEKEKFEEDLQKELSESNEFSGYYFNKKNQQFYDSEWLSNIKEKLKDSSN